MKVRSGFVSNSSTTSFAIVGITVDHDDMEKVYNLDDNYGEIRYYYQGDYSDVYVGIPFYNMELDETLRQFMGRVQEIIDTEFPNQKVSILSDGWYDG